MCVCSLLLFPICWFMWFAALFIVLLRLIKHFWEHFSSAAKHCCCVKSSATLQTGKGSPWQQCPSHEPMNAVLQITFDVGIQRMEINYNLTHPMIPNTSNLGLSSFCVVSFSVCACRNKIKQKWQSCSILSNGSVKYSDLISVVSSTEINPDLWLWYYLFTVSVNNLDI